VSAVDLQTSPSPTRHFLTASWALTARGLTRMQRLPSIALPMVIMPVFFLVAFSGSFAGAVQVEGYGTDEAVNWMAAWAVLQGGAFSGMGAAGSAATDLENGFFDRIRLAPVSTLAVITGLLGYAVIRALLPTTAVLLVAFGLLGADMPGGFLGLVIVYVAAAGIAIVMSLMALAVAFTVKTVKALGFAQILIFVSMFLSVGQAPLVAIEGWLHDVAAVNPITRVIRMTRQGFLEPISWDVAGPGLLALAAMTVVMGAAAIWRFRAITD
jgi:ABC-2 type transport system permease protein